MKIGRIGTDNAGNNLKNDFLELLKHFGDDFCLCPGRSDTEEHREDEGTHNGHDLRNIELEDDVREFFQTFYICNDG